MLERMLTLPAGANLAAGKAALRQALEMVQWQYSVALLPIGKRYCGVQE
ncbi:hypothetical protein [Ktedonosporobacter rubrisoli]|nr:hypothetical protein [Ktedonosporobacter rubrisoli]